MKKRNIDLHMNCQCEIRYRQFRGLDKPTPGLFCQYHDQFLDWLNQEVADQLIQSGVAVAPYKPRRPRSKTYKAKSYFYQRSRRQQKIAKNKV